MKQAPGSNGKETRGANAARRASEADAERLLTGPFSRTREKILRLFLEGKRSIDIAAELGEEIPTENAVSDGIRASIVRKVLLTLATEEQRQEMSRRKHAERMRRNHAHQDRGRDEWMTEHGLRVWTPEETEYFRLLLAQDAFLRDEDKVTKKKKTRERGRHYNHELLAAAMNVHFNTEAFDEKRTRRKLENLRKTEANAERVA